MTTPQKLWSLLTPNHRRSAIGLLMLMFVGMILETMGVGLVIPSLALMMQSNISTKYPILEPWMRFLGNPSHEKLIISGMFILVVVYTLKASFLSFLAWRQAHFVHGVQADLSNRLFIGYLRQPYTFHLNRNSAQLIRNATTETNLFASIGLGAGLTLLTESLVLLGISVMMIAVEPIGALLVVSTLGVAGLIFSRFTRKHIIRWGLARQAHDGFKIQHLQQGLGGAKDAKILGRENDLLSQYHFHNIGSAKVGQRQSILKALPPIWLELLAVTGLAILVLTMIAQGKPLESLLPTLGLFAAAAFRLMPSVNRVLGAIQSIRYALPVIGTLHSEICLFNDTPPPPHPKPLPFKRELTLEHIFFSYPSTEAKALRDINFSIPRGASIGLIGGSGAGKSTLVDIILGLLTPFSGTVKIDGIDAQTNLRGWQDQIGYVPQSIFLTDDTLRRNIAFGLPNDQIEEDAVWRAIRAAQLEQFVIELPQGLDTVVGERGIRLSGGQRQRIGIARALYHDPQVLVLDEATSSLDTDTECSVVNAVHAFQGDKTLIIVAHRLSTVEHCDRLYRLEQGQIIEEGETAMVLGKISDNTN